MRRETIRIWFLIHKWTGLACTAFLLMLCVTGLPLIFHEEIDAALGSGATVKGPASSGTDPSLVPLDAMLAKALAARPGEVPLFMAFDNDGPTLTVTTGPTPDAAEQDMTLQLFDRATGRPIVAGGGDGGMMDFILQLHTDMFLGLPGKLFLGLMGLFFFAATVSGVVLYAPFMRKLGFGTLRVGRSTRLKWIDWHNLLGIVSLAWVSVVGLTGVINTLGEPLVKYWQASELAK